MAAADNPERNEAAITGFDATWYEATYSHDLSRHCAEGETSLDFYRRIGGFLGHDPHEAFSEILYRNHNRDVRRLVTRASGMTGYRHWLEHGMQEEGRHPFTQMQIDTGRLIYLALDREFLFTQYGGRMAGYPTSVDYYVDKVAQEELSPSARFSEAGYRALNGDVTQAIRNGRFSSGFEHYLTIGSNENRQMIAHDRYLQRQAQQAVIEADAKTRQALEDNLPGVTGLAALEILKAMEFYGGPVEIRRGPPVGPGGLMVLVPDFLPEILFGGYLAFYGFLRQLANQTGIRLNLLVVNRADEDLHDGNLLRMQLKMPGIFSMFDSFQKIDGKTRIIEIPGNHHVISYCAELHWIAQKIASSAGQKPIFFIQEYEPEFHANTDMRSFNEAAFLLPHDAVYNSRKLIEFFQKKTPVFDRAGADYRYSAIENHLAPMALTKEQFLGMNANRRTRRFIIYGRPEGHAARNHFAMLVYAIRLAVRRGVFDGQNWEFFAIGSLSRIADIDLGRDATLTMMPKLPKTEYEAFLQTGDVGVSVITTPHPGIVHFQMAAYGLPTVTNRTELRDDTWLAAQNRNLIPVDMEPEAIVEGFRLAVARANDLDARYDNARAALVMDEETCLRDALAFMAGIIAR